MLLSADSIAARPPSAAGAWVEGGFGLYVHWPFCVSKCPYCDFNSHVRAQVDHAAWRQALLTELTTQARGLEGRPLTSIFFGGGTPSLMEPASVAAIIDRATALFTAAADLEITLEANPTTVEAGTFAALAAAGVNRLSLGVQSLDPAALAFLGRAHDAAAARTAIDAALAAVARVSIDLIYALPGQQPDRWASQLSDVLATWPLRHLSLYQLTIEPGTRFHTRAARGDLVIPDEDLATELWQVTQDITAARGLPAYEISNHAARGQESRHNLIYWRYGEYLGIGPGAHGRVMRPATTGDGAPVRRATRTHRAPELWLERVRAHGHGLVAQDPVAPHDAAAEAWLMGLRTVEGVDLARLQRLAGQPLAALLDLDVLDLLAAQGDLTLDSGRVMLTPAGRLRLNAIAAALWR